MERQIAAIVWSGLILSSCTSHAAEERRQLEGQLTSKLEEFTNDPLAIQFRNVRRVAHRGICGEANTKDNTGAYTGFKNIFWDGTETGALVFVEPAAIQSKDIDRAVDVCLSPEEKIEFNHNTELAGESFRASMKAIENEAQQGIDANN